MDVHLKAALNFSTYFFNYNQDLSLLRYCGTYLVPSVSYLTNTVLVHNQCDLFIFPWRK